MGNKLGRGLSHLIPGAPSVTATALQKNPEYQELPLSSIKPNPDQPRRRFSQRELEELAQTLKSVGLIEPVIVRKLGEEFQLISGERRWRACKQAGFKKIPAIIKKLNDEQALEMAIIENIQREELTPIEEARSYEMLIERSGIKASQLATRVGKDRATVTNLLRLLKLPPEIINLLEEKKMNVGQARPLLGIGDKSTMFRLSRKIVDEGWTARRVEDEVARLTGSESSGSTSKKSGKGKGGDANTRSLEEKIRRKYMAKVQVQHSAKGSGRLTIHYGNLDDLERILELMGIKS